MFLCHQFWFNIIPWLIIIEFNPYYLGWYGYHLWKWYGVVYTLLYSIGVRYISLVVSGPSIFSDSRYTGRTSSLLVAVKGQNMPQNSKYSHPRLGSCRVIDGFFSGQPLLPLKRGLVFRSKPYYPTQKHVSRPVIIISVPLANQS